MSRLDHKSSPRGNRTGARTRKNVPEALNTSCVLYPCRLQITGKPHLTLAHARKLSVFSHRNVWYIASTWASTSDFAAENNVEHEMANHTSCSFAQPTNQHGSHCIPQIVHKPDRASGTGGPRERAITVFAAGQRRCLDRCYLVE
jgi:hypothetical protein